MRDLLRDAVEAAATIVEHGAKFVRTSIAEDRNGFSDDEAGEYLRCAGADALAEALCNAEAEQDVAEPRCTQCGGGEPYQGSSKCALCIWAYGTELDTPAADPRAADGPAGGGARRPHPPYGATDSPAGPLSPPRTTFQSASQPSVPGEGPSATDCDILPSPAEGQPTCKHCSQPIELYTDEHPHLGRASVWLHVLGNGQTRVACELTYASPK